MRNTALLILFAVSLFLLLCASRFFAPNTEAAGDPPELYGWLRNTTGATGFNNISADVQQVRYSENYVYINSTGIPDYSIGPWPGNPNTAANQNFVFKIPRHPAAASSTHTSTPLGNIGVWKNGVPMFNALDAMSYLNQNIWHQNAIVVEGPSFDSCLGHPQQQGSYHHHQNPRCLYTASATQHSALLGYAFDGFPVYGPYGYGNTDGSSGIKRIVSSYRQRSITQRHTLADGTVLQPSQYGPNVSTQYPLGYYAEDYEYVSGLGDLDQYNGRFTVTPEYPGGIYAYFVTVNADGSSAYPYIIGPTYYGVVATENITSHGQVTISEPVTVYNGSPTATPTAITGKITTTGGAALSGAVLQLTGASSGKTITDSLGSYNFDGLVAGSFYTITPSRANYTFSPASQSLSLTVNNSNALFTAVAGVETQNPLDTAEYFVRQHYLDFLSREPDNGGFNYWSDQINACGTDAACLRQRRIGVSGAFFVELEFQQTGYVVYRLYRAAFGTMSNAPSRANVTYAQFSADRALLVGGSGLAQSTIDFANSFVARSNFKQIYPDTMSATDFVNGLFDTASLTPFSSERQAEIDALTSNTKTRAQVLLDVIDVQQFKDREYNPAFVLMQYFGYLRRDPDQGGYDFWLDVVNNREHNNYSGMICAFITSTEYQRRFGTIVSHANSECS
jgi:YHYH protein/Domain of unknown function (DUF4214)